MGWLWDWLFAWRELVNLQAENARLQEQHKDDLESLRIQHNRLAQEVYRRQVVERQLAVCQARAGHSGPLGLQPIIIYPSSARPSEPWLPPLGPVPVGPVSEAFRQASDWCAEELGQPVFKLLPLIVFSSLRPLAQFQANMIAECRQVVWDDLKLPLPPTPNPHVVCLVRGMGGFASTVAADWQAPIIGLGDTVLEPLAGIPRPNARDRIHAGWPEEWINTEGAMDALKHELCWHGLAKAREPELGYDVLGHPPLGHPDERSIAGQYATGQIHYTDGQKRLILENLGGI